MNDRAVELLRVLVVDDEQPAVDDLVYLLSTEPDVGDITGVGDATAELSTLQSILESDRDAKRLVPSLRNQ